MTQIDISDFIDFLRQAGEIALTNQNLLDETDISYKAEGFSGIVTKTDIEISALFNTFITKNYADLSYALIDEETVSGLAEDSFPLFENTEYQFIIDPIDGTLTYANQTPLYGISIGILKKGKPYMGAIYAPALHELVYFDGTDIHWIKNAFLDTQKETFLTSKKTTSPIIFKNAPWSNLDLKTGSKENLELNFWSCIVHNLYLITGRAKAAFISAYVWDIAGSWAMLERLGFNIYDTSTGSKLTHVNTDHFNKNLRLSHPHLICHPQDYDEIMNLIKK